VFALLHTSNPVPTFVVGAPMWNAIIGGVFMRLVSRNCTTLSFKGYVLLDSERTYKSASFENIHRCRSGLCFIIRCAFQNATAVTSDSSEECLIVSLFLVSGKSVVKQSVSPLSGESTR